MNAFAPADPLLFSLLAPEAAAHDFCSGVEGSHAETLAAMARAAGVGRQVVVHTLLTRPAFRSVGGLPRLLAEAGAAAWAITVPRSPAAGQGAALHTWMPRLGLAIPYALRALRESRDLGIVAWIRAAPNCTLGPYGSWAAPAASRAYDTACHGCPARPSCPGVDRAYLARHGGGELHPVAPRPAGDGAALSGLFASVDDALPEVRTGAGG